MIFFVLFRLSRSPAPKDVLLKIDGKIETMWMATFSSGSFQATLKAKILIQWVKFVATIDFVLH